MNEANFLDMNFFYRQIYMLYTCISIKPVKIINTQHLICRVENPKSYADQNRESIANA